jgi:hypothetical protein
MSCKDLVVDIRHCGTVHSQFRKCAELVHGSRLDLWSFDENQLILNNFIFKADPIHECKYWFGDYVNWYKVRMYPSVRNYSACYWDTTTICFCLNNPCSQTIRRTKFWQSFTYFACRQWDLDYNMHQWARLYCAQRKQQCNAVCAKSTSSSWIKSVPRIAQTWLKVFHDGIDQISQYMYSSLCGRKATFVLYKVQRHPS